MSIPSSVDNPNIFIPEPYEDSLKSVRELILHNFLAGLQTEVDTTDAVSAHLDDVLASFTTSDEHAAAGLAVNTSLLYHLYTDHISDSIDATTARAGNNAVRAVKRTVGVLSGEAHMRSLAYEAVLDVAGCESNTINELSKKDWHDPEAMEMELWRRIDGIGLTDPEAIRTFLRQMSVIGTRNQLVDEAQFMRDKLRPPQVPISHKLVARFMGHLSRRAA